MKVLITGGAGFIGSNFARMAAKGEFDGIEEIVILDKFTYSGVRSNLNFAAALTNVSILEGDICNPMDCANALIGVNAVINFAAESHVDRSISNASEFLNTNVIGVQILLDQIKLIDNSIRFVQISTDEVYGSITQGSWTESSELHPNSPYSASKASAELIALSYHRTHKIDVVITRSSNNYGPNQFPEKLIPLFITNLLENEKVPIYGSGENIRDWLHVDDHCYGIYKVLTKGKSGEVYNIGGGLELSNLNLADLILEALGKDRNFLEFVEDRKGHDFRYSLDWSKIERELGYFPRVSFDKGLIQTINWYIQNDEWWRPLVLGKPR